MPEESALVFFRLLPVQASFLQQTGIIYINWQKIYAVFHQEINCMNELEDQNSNDDYISRAQRLSDLWDEHVKHEFATRDTEDTLATMV
jgi:hypothetical protein